MTSKDERFLHLVDRPLRLTKVLRLVRRAPARAVSDFFKAFLNDGQVIGLIVAAAGSWLALQSMNRAQMAEAASGWINLIHAFAYVMALWAIVCLIRAPFVIRLEDNNNGDWEKNHWVYNEPMLVARERFEPVEGTQRRQIKFDDAEPGALVFYRMDIRPPPYGQMMAQLVDKPPLDYELPEPGPSVDFTKEGGIRLPANRTLTLLVRLQPGRIPTDFRIYCDSFLVGRGLDEYVP